MTRIATEVCLILGLVWMMASAASASASDSQGHYMSHGVGSGSCGRFVKDVDNYPRDVIAKLDVSGAIQWAEGYITAFNQNAKKTFDILGSTDEEGMQLWLYNYCRANPTVQFQEAVSELIRTIYVARTIKGPTQ